MKLIDREKPLSWPYALLLLAALGVGIAFVTGPARMLSALRQATESGGDPDWAEKVREPALIAYAEGLLSGLLQADLRTRLSKDPGQALADFHYGQSRLAAQARHLARPYGLPYLVCGDFFSDPSQPSPQTGGCWDLQGVIQWRSPVEVEVTLVNPVMHWQSRLQLRRIGLFTWKLHDISLPVGPILQYGAGLSEDSV